MFGNRTFGNGISLDEIKTSSSAFVSVKNKTPDARIAIAMPPCIGTNIMMVMRGDTHYGIYKIVGVSVSAYFFHSSSPQQPQKL